LITISLISQPVAFILLFRYTSARVNAVLRLELLGQIVRIDALYVTSDRVLHLNAVPRIFESDPLHAVVVLAYDQGSGSRNRSRRSV
jgi:hypothetical protein